MYLRFRRWLCRHLHWHRPGLVFGNINDPFQQVYAICRFCGYEGMIDSQGNLF